MVLLMQLKTDSLDGMRLTDALQGLNIGIMHYSNSFI